MPGQRYLLVCCLVWLGQVAFVLQTALAQSLANRAQVLTKGFAVFDSPAADR